MFGCWTYQIFFFFLRAAEFRGSSRLEITFSYEIVIAHTVGVFQKFNLVYFFHDLYLFILRCYRELYSLLDCTLINCFGLELEVFIFVVCYSRCCCSVFIFFSAEISFTHFFLKVKDVRGRWWSCSLACCRAWNGNRSHVWGWFDGQYNSWYTGTCRSITDEY